MRRSLAAIAFAAIGACASAADFHGETDLFSRDGVSLAWAVARGADEAKTMVVVRVAAEAAVRSITVKGQDPFTKAEKTVAESPLVEGRAEVRLPRASFADFPRTEWQFLGADGKSRLRVYYLGIPDTTPEFVDEKRLDSYLAERLTKATPRRP